MKLLSVCILAAIAAVAVQAKKKGPKITNKARALRRIPREHRFARGRAPNAWPCA